MCNFLVSFFKDSDISLRLPTFILYSVNKPVSSNEELIDCAYTADVNLLFCEGKKHLLEQKNWLTPVRTSKILP